ncbi:hypothetical protein RM572_21705 [Streptomyces sp. DSM 42041]|uniref:Uncharacterized protein n=1 Tax=Streptomyces hazeniae TaxID=3075538 RepID=A0ABU2NZI7_9ACTN|nr:hypothetical protein [Streptomyces sp. DSM 42041]MDT0381377.1 hypothetical protein [Streptomyces sp. DSM 42041]
MSDARLKHLYAEEIPTGRFGGAPWRPSARPVRRGRLVISDEEATQNVLLLAAEVAAHDAAQRAAGLMEAGEAA